MKRILCYGDSNTWGFIPGSGQRYSEEIRWTRILADDLGDDYEIIEAGLSGRTTVFDDPFNPMLNGLSFLPMTLVQSMPLDMIIISLGSNDLKYQNAYNSARGIHKLADTCKKANQAISCSCPIFNEGAKTLVVSPIAVDPCITEINPYTSLRHDAPAESLKYPELVKHFTDVLGVEFFDAATVAVPSKVDGLHMDPESHVALGKALAGKVREFYL